MPGAAPTRALAVRTSPAARGSERPACGSASISRIGRKAGPEATRRAAVQAEAIGFADVRASEHISVPRGAAYPPSPIFYDPVLTWAAAAIGRSSASAGLGGSRSRPRRPARARSAATTVFSSSIVTVIGPTPPGTGVI